ncbi:hypothetical protein AB0M05_47280 [Streptomyces violaceusniger]|uniref:hypothetical protein n=1 Tax=Streptomyces violaceusniger TaxID=68280 RepID=UPI00341DBE60
MTPEDYDVLFEQSLDEAAFSNSDEGLGWTEANCATCVHDRPARQGDPARGCPLILVSLMDRRPVQWIDGPLDEHGAYSLAGQYHCVEYRHEDDGPTDPEPIPDPPGQLELFPREPYTGVRMWLRPNPAAFPAGKGAVS